MPIGSHQLSFPTVIDTCTLGNEQANLDTVTLYPYLTASFNQTKKVRISVKTPLVRLRVWAAFFFVLILMGLISSLPYYISIIVPARNTQKTFPITKCTLASLNESLDDYSGSGSFLVEIEYTDITTIIHTVAVTYHLRSASDFNHNILKFYEKIQNSGEPFFCYYKNNYVEPTDIVQKIVTEAHFQAKLTTILTTALMCGAILILGLFYWFIEKANKNDKTVVNKDAFEKNSPLFFEDWDTSKFSIQQPLHTLIYCWLEKTGTTDFADKKVKITELKFLPSDCLAVVAFGIVACILLGGSMTLLAFSFMAPVNEIITYWSNGAIVNVLAGFVIIVTLDYKNLIKFHANVEISSKTDNSSTRIKITKGDFYPSAILGYALVGSVSQEKLENHETST